MVALLGSLFVVGLSFGAGAPLVSAILEQRGFSEYFTGAVGAVLAVAVAASSPWVGRLVERHGPRRVNLLGIVTQAVGFVAVGLALASNEWLLFPARLWLGFAATLTFVAAEVALLRGVRPAVRGRVMAAYGAATGSGFATGVWLADLTYDVIGLWCFGLVAAIALMVWPLAARGLREPADEPAMRSSDQPSQEPLPWAPLLLTLSGAFIYSAVDAAMTGAYPVEGQRLGLSRGQALNIVGLVVLGSVAAQPLFGWLADRWDTLRTLATIALLGLASALATGLLATRGSSLPWLGVGFLFLGTAIGGSYPVCLKLLAERVADHHLARANARFGATYGYAALIGPLAGAAGIDVAERTGHLGWALPGLCAVLFIAVLPLLWWDGRRQRSPGAGSSVQDVG